jgi:hypothetical protein
MEITSSEEALDAALAIQKFVQDRARAEIRIEEPPYYFEAQSSMKAADKIVARMIALSKHDHWIAERAKKEATR